MTIYKNISIENIREQKTNKEKRKENKYFWRCVDKTALITVIITLVILCMVYVYLVVERVGR
jgi:type IV secretory pathway component VirB8